MILDTNIVIAYLAGESKVIEFLDPIRSRTILFLPTVIESEVLSFRDWTEQDRESTEQYLEENFTSIPFDRNIARVAAEIRRSTRIKFPDAAIAATALFLRTPLVTRNVDDFKNVPNLKILSI